MTGGRPPVIIIGMHRSGTSLLTRILQRFGFFMGVGASRNEEARFTNAVNEWLFREASATWDRPESIDWLLRDTDLRPELVDYMTAMVKGPASLRFLGLSRWVRYRNMHRLIEPWGFKDPRNTYTLPLWLEVFPDARVLHIVRHGVDVAASLRTRRIQTMQGRVARYRRFRTWHSLNPLAPKRRGFGPQVRCGRLEEGLILWQAYVERARRHLADVGERGMEVAYEELLANPAFELGRTLSFCGMEQSPECVNKAAAGLNQGRAFAYRADPELRDLAHSMAGALERIGYAP